MNFTLTIDCDNAAFTDDPAEEIAVILHIAGQKLKGGKTEGVLQDGNGNTVGRFELTGEAEEDNEDQDEAENVCSNVEHLYHLGRIGEVAELEIAVRHYCDTQRIKPFNPDNVDYEALVAFIQE